MEPAKPNSHTTTGSFIGERDERKCKEHLLTCLGVPWIHEFKGCGMGTLFVFVSPCFRENVVITCKIGSFLCSLDNLLQKSIIVFFFFFFLNQISK